MSAEEAAAGQVEAARPDRPARVLGSGALPGQRRQRQRPTTPPAWGARLFCIVRSRRHPAEPRHEACGNDAILGGL